MHPRTYVFTQDTGQYDLKTHQFTSRRDLSTNKLTDLPSTVFGNLRRLVYLHIGDNQISVIAKYTFAGLQRLKDLYVKSYSYTNHLIAFISTFSVGVWITYLYVVNEEGEEQTRGFHIRQVVELYFLKTIFWGFIFFWIYGVFLTFIFRKNLVDCD